VLRPSDLMVALIADDLRMMLLHKVLEG